MLTRPGPGLRAIVLDADGPNFSFGASVEEHLPGKCVAMLKQFHALTLQFLGLPIPPVLVAVRGQCLGGGLELACAGSRLFAGPNALFSQPEITVGVFAPAASCLLPWRIGPANAEDLLTSGRSIGAGEAKTMGLVSEVASDPEAAALAYFEEHLLGKSAAVLRLAMQAAGARPPRRHQGETGARRGFISERTHGHPRCQGGPQRLHVRPVGRTVEMFTAPIIERCQELFDDLDFKVVRPTSSCCPTPAVSRS